MSEIKRCDAHNAHYDTRWGCPFCPSQYDLAAVLAMRIADNLTRELAIVAYFTKEFTGK